MRVKSLLLALGLSLVVGKSFAISFKVDGINYLANADTAIVKGYSNIPENGELKLASTVTYGGKEYRVTTVQGSAFLSCTEIKKLVIPASLKYIEKGAFESCVNMNNLVLEQGDDRLDAASDAFKNCSIEEATIGRNLKARIFENNTNLQKVILCDNIKRIIPYAFSSCSNLAEINLDKIEEIGDGAFYSCSSIKKVTLGNVRVIRNSVFSSCSNLQDINLDDIEEIGESAFSYCTNLKNVSLGSLKSLGRRAFAGSGLQEVELPLGLTDFGGAAFENSALTKVVLKSGISTIPAQAFCDCYNLVNVDIPNTVTEISYSAFQNCAFTAFDMKNVKKISSKAFWGCQNLETVNWGNVSYIDAEVFRNCDFKNLTFPASLQTISYNAFAGCQKLQSVDMSETTVSSISGFSDCKSLRDVKFPDNLATIGYRAFYDCSSLESISIPDAVQSLGDEAFANSTLIKEIDLSKTKVQKISPKCFANCSSLAKVLLNERTDTICERAFENCLNLKDLINAENINMVYSSAFYNTKVFEDVAEGPVMIGSVMYAYNGTISDKEYVVPGNVTCLADLVFANQPFQSIKLNANLKYIGSSAFKNCANLLSLTIPVSVKVIEASSGCTKLAVMTLKEGEDDLALGEFSGNQIKKFYMGRNVSSSIDWMPELENLTIGKYVKSIGSDFSSSKNLANLELEDADGTLDFGNNPLVGRITSLYLGRNIKVGTYEGKDEYVYWDEKVTRGNSFISLSDLTIGEKVTKLCDYFCEYNTQLENLNIPHNVKEIGKKAFYRVYTLKNLEFNEGLQTIGELAFGYADDPFNIAYSPASKATIIKEIMIPASVKQIGKCAFSCVHVGKLKLLEGVGLLDDKCFLNIQTDSVVLPSTLKLQGRYCFAYGGLKYVDASRYKGLLNSAFTFNSLMKTVLLNDDLEILDNDFNCCNSLTEITLPSKLKKIGGCEFMGVPIRHLIIPESVTEIGGELLESNSYYGNQLFVPSVTIQGTSSSLKVTMNDSFCWSGETRSSEKKLVTLSIYKDVDYTIMADYGTNETNIGMDSLILGDIKEFTINSTDGKRFVPTTAICLSHYLTSCDMWKPTNGKIYVLPGSQLPKDDITYMYTVNKLEYTQDAAGNVLFDGVNNMPYEITPVFFQDDNEVELKEVGTYDLSMKISGTSFDGVYPTGLKVTVGDTSGINNITMDSDNRNCPIYNMSGQRVDKNYKGVVIQNGKKRIAK